MSLQSHAVGLVLGLVLGGATGYLLGLSGAGTPIRPQHSERDAVEVAQPAHATSTYGAGLQVDTPREVVAATR